MFLKLNTLKTFLEFKINNHDKYSNINQDTKNSLPEVNHDEYHQQINIIDNNGIVE